MLLFWTLNTVSYYIATTITLIRTESDRSITHLHVCTNKEKSKRNNTLQGKGAIGNFIYYRWMGIVLTKHFSYKKGIRKATEEVLRG